MKRKVKEKDKIRIRLFNPIKKKGAKEFITKFKRDTWVIMIICPG